MADEQSDSAAANPASLDPQALVERHGDRLLRSAFLLCGNEAEAQDLTQETFLQALKSAPRFRGRSAAFTWLYGILRHVYFHRLREQRRLVFDEAAVLNEPAAAAAETKADAEFCSTRLQIALQRLSPEHREVMVLRYFDELKIQEISAWTGVSKGTVKSRLHYAIAQMRELLPEEMNLFAGNGTHRETTQ